MSAMPSTKLKINAFPALGRRLPFSDKRRSLLEILAPSLRMLDALAFLTGFPRRRCGRSYVTIALTRATCQFTLPLGVGTPRASRARATPDSVVTPLRSPDDGNEVLGLRPARRRQGVDRGLRGEFASSMSAC